MGEQVEHTPIPWHVGHIGKCYNLNAPPESLAILADPKHRQDGAIGTGACIGVISPPEHTTEEDYANADFICRAVNSHYDMLNALKDALKTNDRDMQHCLDNGRLRDVIREAIAQAEPTTTPN